jgi:hypothetical protein
MDYAAQFEDDEGDAQQAGPAQQGRQQGGGRHDEEGEGDGGEAQQEGGALRGGAGVRGHAGGGQGSGTLLTGNINRVTTVATAGDSVLLPPSAPGLDVIVINKGANPMQVFGSGTDTIDDIATATGVSQMANSFVLYACTFAGKWYSEGLASGFGGPGLATASFSASVT